MLHPIRELFTSKPPTVSPKQFCPACGNPGCTLKFIEKAEGDGKQAKPQVESACKTCGAKWYRDCVLAPEKWFVPEITRAGR